MADKKDGDGKVEEKKKPADKQLDVEVANFVRKHKALIELEREAEIEEELVYKSNFTLKELEERGIALSRLVVSDTTSGLYGRCMVTFENSKGHPLNVSKFAVRDVVEILPPG